MYSWASNLSLGGFPLIQINRLTAFPLLFSVVLYLVVPNPGVLLAANETLAYDSQTGSLTPVKTYISQEQISIPIEKPVFPQDFRAQDHPLSPASAEPGVTEKEPVENQATPLQPAADNPPEVFMEGLDSSYVEPLNSSEFEALSKDTYSGTSGMWGFNQVQAEKAWTISRGNNTTIAVIDTGIDFAHVDRGSLWTNSAEANGLAGVDDDGDGFVDDIHGWDFVNNDNLAQDDNGHGTHVSGIINAKANNNTGIAGVAPDAKILPLKVLNAAGSGFISSIISAINYAVKLGVQVINMSLGVLRKYLSSTDLKNFQGAVNNAKAKGIIVVSAAGNNSIDTALAAPGGLDNVISVGATDSSNRKASFSNTNPDLAAPGVNILSLKTGGGYIYMSGTSMASPYVAAVAALLKSSNPKLTYDDIFTRLTRSGTDLGSKGYDSSFGYGLVNAYAALTYKPAAAVSLLVPKPVTIIPIYNPILLVRGIFGRFSADPEIGFTPRITGNWYQTAYDEEELLRLKKKKKKRF